MTIAQSLRDASHALAGVSAVQRHDAELLMAHALGVTRSEMLLHRLEDPVPFGFARLLERRRAHEPMAYILGSEPFFGLEIAVSRDVLIPRGDSEVLVAQALAARPDAKKVLDCGTGSGALLLAVLSHLPDATGVGIDCSPAALKIARRNAMALGLAARAGMHLADWTAPGWAEALGGPFDLILVNPPYVEISANLEPSVRDYEPALALFAGPDGLDAYRALLPQLPGLFAPGGVALVEIGADQTDAVRTIADEAGLSAVLHRDGGDRPRVLQLSTAK